MRKHECVVETDMKNKTNQRCLLETSRWESDQGPAVLPAHVSKLLWGPGARGLAPELQGGLWPDNSCLPHAAPHGPGHRPSRWGDRRAELMGVKKVSLTIYYCISPCIKVCDKSPEFKDAKLLNRFGKDDGTFPFNTKVKIFTRGQQLYEKWALCCFRWNCLKQMQPLFTRKHDNLQKISAI